MMEDSRESKNKIVLITFIALVPHGIIFFSFINLMPSGGDWGGGMTNLVNAVKFIFFAIAFSTLIPFIYIILNRVFLQRPFWLYLILIIIFAGTCFANQFLCKKILFITPYTKKELIKKQEDQVNRMRKAAEEVLTENKCYLASPEVVLRDKIKILSVIYKELNVLRTPIMYDNLRYPAVVNRLDKLSFGFSEIPSDSTVISLKRSIVIDKIFYSPDFNNFLAILTREVCSDTLNRYGHFILLGHKEKDKVYCLAFRSNGLQIDYNTYATRRGAMYRGLSECFFWSNQSSFGHYELFLTPKQVPPKAEFWTAPKVIAFLKCKKDTVYLDKKSTLTFTTSVYTN
jgi:hypothetical protein